VIAGGFVGSFIEASDQVLKDQAHGDVVNLAGMQVEFGELGYDLIQPVGFFQLLNLFFKLETLKNLADILGKAIDVVDQVATDVVWIALQLLKIELAVIVKTKRLPLIIFGQIVEDGIDIGNASGTELLVTLEHGLLGGREHSIKAAQYRERQHDALVLRRSVRPT